MSIDDREPISTRRMLIEERLREVWGGALPASVAADAVRAADDVIAAYFGVDTESETDAQVWASETS